MTRENPDGAVLVAGQSNTASAEAPPTTPLQPEARCLCGSPAADHVRLRYVLRAWVTHRWIFGFGALRGRL